MRSKANAIETTGEEEKRDESNAAHYPIHCCRDLGRFDRVNFDNQCAGQHVDGRQSAIGIDRIRCRDLLHKYAQSKGIAISRDLEM
jgi:hypothetical protein